MYLRRIIVQYLFTVLLAVVFGDACAQPLGLGQWRAHLPYIKAKAIVQAGEKIFCASDRGMFIYRKDENSVEALSKISGLSELDVVALGYDPTRDVQLVAYANSNIDLLVGNDIINLPDIKRKNITGDKSIYGIEFRGSLAYVSCGFGIVVIDLVRKEVRETYVIGPAGSSIRVFDVTFQNDSIYAATERGVLAADVNNPALVNYASWITVLEDANNAGDYNIIESFNGQLFANYAKPDALGNTSADSLYVYDGGGWSPSTLPIPQGVEKIRAIHVNEGTMTITTAPSGFVFNTGLGLVRQFGFMDYSNPAIRDGFAQSDGTIWVADNQQGLVRIKNNEPLRFIFPDGPASDLISAMDVEGGTLWVTHATRSQSWVNTYAACNFSSYSNSDWLTYNAKTKPGTVIETGNLFDNMSVAIDPSDPSHVFVGSKGNGLLEMRNGAPVKTYRDTNSTLQVGIGNPTQCQVVGMDFDANRRLWVLNSLAAEPVNMLSPQGTWRKYSIPGIPGAPLFGDMTVDSYGQKWINVIGNNAPLGSGLVVFDDNGTLDITSDDRSRFYTTGVGNGNLPSVDIRAITEDLEGEIWLGTGRGVAVIYSPSSSTTSSNFDAQQILIKQDGINQYLLESEVVTAIAVDGANRKWIGTEAGGLFLMSADGTEQILNFNELNSPLLSNYIIAISIDQQTGEVFIGTNRGIVSYKGDAIKGEGPCGDIVVYPNPVREGYNGPIAISGLVANGSFKVTDVSGSLVYEGRSNGTQAVWNGTDFSGRRVQTGVYLVFSTDDTGEYSCTTKVLFIN